MAAVRFDLPVEKAEAQTLAGLQVWNAVSMNRVVETAIGAADTSAATADLEREKTRQGRIGKQIENETKAALAIGLTAGLSAAIAALATILGAILTLWGHIDPREREREERRDAREKDLVTREKERQDRLASDLNETLARLVSQDWRQRVVGSAGLLPFFAADREDFQFQAFTALIAAARIDDDEPAVRPGVRLAAERAVRAIAPTILRELCWQGVFLRGVELGGVSLTGVDPRDAVLETASFAGAQLDGATLVNARLQGSRFDDASSWGLR